MTGRYPWRVKGFGESGPWGFLAPRMAKDHFTIGRMLQSAGYETGYVGKWHLGTLMTTSDGKTQGLHNVDYGKPLLVGPNDYGFDEAFILPGSLDMYPYVFAKNRQWQGPVTKQRGWSAFNRIGPTAEDFEDDQVLKAFNTEAEAFLDRSAKAAKPFFLYLALTSPHTPTSPSPDFAGKSKIGIYGDFVMETDDCVLRVLNKLDQLGLTEDTLVIATSDHGPAPYAGKRKKATHGQLRELEEDGHYASGIYRGSKFSVYEGANRVPLVVRWPNKIKAGSQCDRLVGLNDMMATFAEVAGAELTSQQAPDSVSLLALLENPQAAPGRETMILQDTHHFIVRDGSWKLALCPGSGSHIDWGNTPIAQEAWASAVASIGRAPKPEDLRQAPFLQLFDLSKDIGETRNLAAEHAERVAGMIALLEKAITNGRTTPGETLLNDFKAVRFLPKKPQPVRPKE